jgi:uncharacterized protein
VVLDGLVRDELVLGIPMIPLCSEDCPGIHPGPVQQTQDPSSASSGEPRTDPRFAPLLALKGRLGGDAQAEPKDMRNGASKKKRP